MWCKHVHFLADHRVEALAIVVDLHSSEGDCEAGEVDDLRWGLDLLGTVRRHRHRNRR
jgi:hypothetical protein